jgi:hypothetical protein
VTHIFKAANPDPISGLAALSQTRKEACFMRYRTLVSLSLNVVLLSLLFALNVFAQTATTGAISAS